MRRFLPAMAGVLALVGCRAQGEKPGFVVMPGMQQSVPYDAYDANPLTRNGATLLVPPAGTVPIESAAFPYGPGPEEAVRAGLDLSSPIASTPENLARGKQVFENVCAVCHGPGGQGDGPIIGRFPNPPSLTAAKAKGYPDGRIIHIISRGQGIMPSHAAQVLMEDRWRVLQYVRELQKGPAAAPNAAPVPTGSAVPSPAQGLLATPTPNAPGGAR